MLPFRFVRRSRRPAAPSRVTVSAPRVDRLEDRSTPAAPLLLSPQAPFTTQFTFGGEIVRTGDFDGDGFADYVSANGNGSSGPELEIGLNNGSKFGTQISFTRLAPIDVGVGQTGVGLANLSVAVGDFAATQKGFGPDGNADIVVGTTDDKLVLYRSLGTGTFDAGTVIALTPTFSFFGEVTGLASGDVNEDGLVDLIVARSDQPTAGVSTEYSVLINNGVGGFQQTPPTAKTGFGSLRNPRLVDVDLDGHLDLVGFDGGAFPSPSASRQVGVYFGKGDGTFDAVARAQTPLGRSGALSAANAGDFNGDGAGDLVVGYDGSDFIDVFYGDPALPRTFNPADRLPVRLPNNFASRTTDFGVADLNFDGTDDIVVGLGFFGNTAIFLGEPFDPTGANPNALTESTLSPLASEAAEGIAMDDFNGDTKPDFLVVGWPQAQNQLFLNVTQAGGVVTINDLADRFSPFDTFDTTFVGQPLGFEVAVSKFRVFPSGTVTLTANNQNLGTMTLDAAGKAVFTIPGDVLRAGTYQITANYVPDPASASKFPANLAVIPHRVLPLSTQLTAASSVANPVFGQPVTLTASVDVVQPTDAGGNPFGPPVSLAPGSATPATTVVFYDNGNLIGAATVGPDGTAAFTPVRLSLGDHPIQAKYLGNTDFLSSESEFVPLNVDPAQSQSSLTVTPRAVNFGDTVTLNALVAIVAPGVGTPSGDVQFFRDGTLLGIVSVGADGKSSFRTTPPAAGRFDFTARFVGTDAVGPSTSNAARVTVAPTVSTATLTIGAGTTLADVVPVTVTVLDPQNRPLTLGTVDVSALLPDGTTRLLADNQAVINGVATFNLPLRTLGLGETTLSGAYTGDGATVTDDATSDISLTVVKATPPVTFTNTAGAATVPLNKDITFTATFAPTGAAVETPTGTVTFLDNGTAVQTVPLAAGKAAFSARLPLGGHTITATYSGDAIFAAGSFSTAVAVVRPTEGFVASATAPGGDRVLVFNPDGSFNRTVFAFGPDSTSGVRVATGDLTGDGIPDFAVGTGPGATARVRVLDGGTGEPLFETFPFETFTGGVFVAIGDTNGDLRPDVVVTPDEGGGPRVQIYSGNTFGQIADYFGIDDPNFRGGARAAVGDINGDGTGDVIVSAGFMGGPRVAFWDGRGFAAQGTPPRKLFNDFFAFEQGLRNGTYVAVGDIDGDGFADPVFGAGPGGSPRVIAMSGFNLSQTGGANRTLIANFFAGGTADRGGVPVAVKNTDGDNLADVITGSAGGSNAVSVYAGSLFRVSPTPTGPSSSINAFDDGTNPLGGVFVG